MAKVEIGEIDFGTRRKYDLMKISRELFRLMMNNPKCDYATLEEMFAFEEMENYDPEEVCKAVDELTGKEDYNNLLLEIVKPYGKVYAVNKRRIPEMMFTYGRRDGRTKVLPPESSLILWYSMILSRSSCHCVHGWAITLMKPIPRIFLTISRRRRPIRSSHPNVS